mgnify:CR=1 FL=1
MASPDWADILTFSKTRVYPPSPSGSSSSLPLQFASASVLLDKSSPVVRSAVCAKCRYRKHYYRQYNRQQAYQPFSFFSSSAFFLFINIIMYFPKNIKKAHPTPCKSGRIRLLFLYSFQLDRKKDRVRLCVRACVRITSMLPAAILSSPFLNKIIQM